MHGVERRVIEILHRADDRVPVRVVRGIEPGTDQVSHFGVGAILTLALFILDDTSLFIERLLRHGAEQVAHAIAFHPQGHVQRARRHRREIIGAIFGRRTVHARRPGIGERREVFALAILCSLEHQVLEKMREPGLSVRFVFRPDAVPHADEYGRRGMIGMHDDGQAVIQPEHLVGNIDLRGNIFAGCRLHHRDYTQQHRGCQCPYSGHFGLLRRCILSCCGAVVAVPHGPVPVSAGREFMRTCSRLTVRHYTGLGVSRCQGDQ